MALVLADRVKESTTTAGTGTITLGGAATGYTTFLATIGNGNTTYYTIAGQGTNEWEVGIGTYTSSGNTLSRDTVLASSAGAPTKTTFSVGTKDVFVTYPATQSIYKNASGVANITSTDVTTALGYTPVTNARSLTINGTAYDLSADRTWSVGTVTSVTGTAPVVSSGGTTPAISMAAATGSVNGYLTSTDWTTFNNKAPGVIFTTGYIPFGQGTTTLNQSANLFWDNSNARLGIGTVTPTSKLHVLASTTSMCQFTGPEYAQVRHSDGTRVFFTQVYDNVAQVGTESSTPIAFVTNNTQKMRLDTNGLLGIGLTPSGTTTLLQVNSDALINSVTVGKGGGSVNGNTAVGYQSLNANTTEANNTAIGYQALNANTISGNTALGYQALFSNTTGQNTGVGFQALRLNVTGTQNTALGYNALSSSTGNSNVGVGHSAGQIISTGINNTAIGAAALSGLTTGNSNTAIGKQALTSTTGSLNTGIGNQVLLANTTGASNTAIGNNALLANIGGSQNISVGDSSGAAITSGTQNTILGTLAGKSGTNDLTTGSNNTIIGYNAAASSASISNEITLGNASVNNFRIPGISATIDANNAVIATLTVGKGGGAVASNTAVGYQAINATATGALNTGIGQLALTALTSGNNNTGVGRAALYTLTSGTDNTAVGTSALFNNNGSFNTALGTLSLTNNTTAANNTGVGYGTLTNTTTGTNNLASGYYAMRYNVTGQYNTAVGANALLNSGKSVTAPNIVTGVSYTILTIGTTDFTLIGASANTVGLTFTASGVGTGTGTAASNTNNNTAIGYIALNLNTTGSGNVALGTQSLYSNLTGSANTALGFQSFYNNTASYGTSLGYQSLFGNTSGSDNVAFGYASAYTNSTASRVTAIGTSALNLSNASNCTALGWSAGAAITSGQQNTIIGASAGKSGTNDLTTGSNNIIIGYNAAASSATVSNEVTIGNDSIVNTRLKGNVGINQTPAAWYSDYTVMQIGLAGAVFNDNYNEDMNVSSNAYADTRGGYKYLRTGWAQRYAQTNSGQHRWYTSAASGTAGNAITFTQAMTLDNSGRLGIGQSSPSVALDIKGTQATVGALTYSQTISSTQAYNASPLAGISFANIYTSGGTSATLSGIAGGKENATDGDYASYLGFYTRPNGLTISERMRIDSSGNVGIGTTSPTAKLQVTRYGGGVGINNNVYVDVTSSFGGITINATAGNNTFLELMQGGTTKRAEFGLDSPNGYVNIGGFNGYIPIFWSAGAEAGRFDTNGDFWDIVNSSTTSGYVKFGDGATAYSAMGGFYTSATAGYMTFSTLSTTLQERMRIFSSGGVSIGNTTDPGASNLSVSGTVSGVGTVAVTGSASDTQLQFNVTGYYLNWIKSLVLNNSMLFATQNTERMRIWGGGGLSLGNTTDPGAANLSVTGQTSIGTSAAPTAVLTLAAGTATANTGPLKFTSGTNLTTPEAGVVEYDGTVMTATTNTSFKRGTIPITNYTSGAGTNLTGNSETTLQNLLPSANDTITLPIGTYFLDVAFNVTRTGTSTTSATARLNILGGGATTVGSFSGMSLSAPTAGGTTGAFSFSAVNINTSNVLTAASTTAGGVYTMTLRGLLKITTAGTIIPQYNLSATLGVGGAGGASVNVLYFRLQQVDTQSAAAFGPAGTGWA